MSNSSYVIRNATRTELDQMIDWARAENWNPGNFDADCFYAADPSGFWLGVLDGEAIASLSAVKYGKTFAFVGFYIVRPEFRGQGFGWRLWQTVLAPLGDRNLALDGVVEQQANYRKSGFQLAHCNLRYAGVGGGELPQHPGLVPLAQLPFAQVAAYDAGFFPGDRATFLHHWLRQPQSTAVGMVVAGELKGYGMVRVSHQGYRLGPLFADDEAIADVLLLALKSHIPAGTPVYLDVPLINAAAQRLMAQHAMSPGFETARMYTQSLPELPYDRWYGVTTLEVG